MADEDIYTLVHNGGIYSFHASDVDTSAHDNGDGYIRINIASGRGAGVVRPGPRILEVSTSEYEEGRDKLARNLDDFNTGRL